MLLKDRFMRHVNKIPNGCWEWTGYKDKQGYGRIGMRGRAGKANRIAWEIFRGPIPKGMFSCHSCNNTSCVNPKHLYIGTPLQNTRHAVRDGLWKPFYGENHPRAKLTMKKAIEIRTLYKKGNVTHKGLALFFNVSRPLISMVIRNELWVHNSPKS